MTREHIAALFDYDRTATTKLLEIIGRIPEELYVKNLESSHGGIRGTLVHMIAGADLWLKRWRGEQPASLLGESDLGTFSQAEQKWKAYFLELESYLGETTNEQLYAPFTYKDMRGKEHTLTLWRQMQHLVNHGSYHRGQLVTLLRQSGVKPVGTDLIYYYLEKEKNG